MHGKPPPLLQFFFKFLFLISLHSLSELSSTGKSMFRVFFILFKTGHLISVKNMKSVF